MAIFKVEGGHRLHGSITPQGAKNEALQILCATLLTPERVTISNIPRILDAGNRTLAGPTVPPGGLYLTKLWYEDERLNG